MKRSISNSSVATTPSDASHCTDHGDTSESLSDIWKYSRTRQIAFWMRRSVRNAVTPNLNAVYEDDKERESGKINFNGNETETLEEDEDEDEHDESDNDRRHHAQSLHESVYEHEHEAEGALCIEDDSRYVCDNIDEAMRSLYTLPSDMNDDFGHDYDRNYDSISRDDSIWNTDRSCYGATNKSEIAANTLNNIRHISHPYDWLLDGDPIEGDDFMYRHHDHHTTTQAEPIATKPKQEGIEINDQDEEGSCRETGMDDDLHIALSGMELEQCSTDSSDPDATHVRREVRNLSPQCSPLDGGQISLDIDLRNDMNLEAMKSLDELEAIRAQAQGDSDSTPPPSKQGVASQKVKKWDAIPDFLPFEDPSTLAGSFIRRLQMENDLDAIDSFDSDDVAPEFCDEGHDPFLNILEETCALWEGDGDEQCVERDEYIIETLSSLDEMSQNVNNVLLKKIHEKDLEIQQELRRVQNVDLDVASALSCAKQASSYLQRARGRDEGFGASRGGIFGGDYVIEESKEREKIRKVDDLLKSIEELAAMEASVFDFVDNFVTNVKSNSDGLTAFLKTCESLKNRLLEDERYLRLRCLDESRERVSHIIEYSCKRIEEQLMLLLFQECKMHDDLEADMEHLNDARMIEYNMLFDTRVVFDNHRLQEAGKDGEKESEDAVTQSHFALTWSSCIVEALCFEADRCLSRALLDPTQIIGQGINGPSEFDSNLSDIELKVEEIQLFNEDSASLRSLTMNLLSIRFEFDNKEPNIVGIFHMLCSSLANVLHSHYKISEWHKDQIDNNCVESVHTRCETPDQKVESSSSIQVERIDMISKDDHTKSTSSSNCSRSSSSSQVSGQICQYENAPSIPQCISGPDRSESEGSCSSLNPKNTKGVRETFLDTKIKVWQHCKGVMITFLKTIITFNEKKEQCEWSLSWMQDLESFHDIFELCKQMIVLGTEFISSRDNHSTNVLQEDFEPDCEIRKTLTTLFTKYIEGAHVEAMTEIGTMMACETWDVLPIPIDNDVEKDPSLNTQNGVKSFLDGVEKSFSSMEKSMKFSYNQFNRLTADQLFPAFSNGTNPFQLIKLDNEAVTTNHDRHCTNHKNASRDHENIECQNRISLYQKVSTYICTQEDELVLGTKTSLNGLARWTMRLISIQSKLPIIGDQLAGILSNIYDLYFLTVFRLCVGNAESEAIVLGSKNRSDHTFNQRFPQDLSKTRPQTSGESRANSFGRKRLNNAQKENARAKTERLLSTLLSKYCAADINAPLKSEESETTCMQKFIYRGQAALSSMVSLDQIENWSLCNDGTSKLDEDLYSAKCLESLIVAASSCLLVACIFDSAVQSLPLRSRMYSPLAKYSKQMMNVSLFIHTISLRICGSRAIMSRSVVSNIISIGDGWSKSNLNEHCNAYVDRLSDRYGVLWAHLSSSSLNEIILRDAWEHVVECGYLALLEGFSKIFECSTEGRALMSIDLATFTSNINKHGLSERIGRDNLSLRPPSVFPRRGMQYVDTYIKVFYFPSKDVQSWIVESRHKYHLSHLMALVSIGAHNQLPPAELSLIFNRRQEVRNCMD